MFINPCFSINKKVWLLLLDENIFVVVIKKLFACGRFYFCVCKDGQAAFLSLLMVKCESEMQEK